MKKKKNYYSIWRHFKTSVDGIYEDNNFEVLEAQNCVNGSEWRGQAQVSGKWIELKVDIGVQADLLPWKLLSKINEAVPVTIQNSGLRDYNRYATYNYGSGVIPEQLHGNEARLTFIVVQDHHRPLLGLSASVNNVDNGSREQCVVQCI